MTWPEAAFRLIDKYGWPLITVLVAVAALAAIVYLARTIGSGGRQVASEASLAITRVLEHQSAQTEILRGMTRSLERLEDRQGPRHDA